MKLRKRGTGRLAAVGTGSAAMAIMALMLLAPLSAGTVVIPAKKFGAQISYGVSVGACAHAKQTVAPKWSGVTGVFKTAGSATAPKCAPSPSTNFADWNAQVYLNTLIHFKTAGSYTFTTSWKVTESASWTVTPYTSCVLNYKVAYSSCAVSAGAEIFGYSYLYDQNNGSYFNFGSFVTMSNYTTVQNYSQNYCYAGTCTHYGGNYSSPSGSGSMTGSFYLNSTVSATGANAVNNNDTYQLSIVLFALADAQASVTNAKSTGTGTASAMVNIGTLGYGAQLVSVSYS